MSSQARPDTVAPSAVAAAVLPVWTEVLEPRRLLATVSGTVFNDINGNGVLDTFEDIQAGISVFIDADGDRVQDSGETATVTDATGAFRFDGLAPGQYLIYAVPPTGQNQTTPGNSGALLRPSRYNIDIVFLDNGTLSDRERTIVETAAAKWESVLVGDLPDVADTPYGLIDDIRLEVRTFSEASGLLGFYQGGPLDNSGFDPQNPALYRSEEEGFLPYVGNLSLNQLALGNDEQTFQDTVLHEMGHALGFFDDMFFARGLTRGLSRGPFGGVQAGPDPQFIGANAVREYNEIFSRNGDSVPLENFGQASHWRESVFISELMDPFANGTFAPLSRVTVGAFQDLGYGVDYAAADFYEPETGLGSEQIPTVVGDDAFAGSVRPFEILAVVFENDDVLDRANFGHRKNTAPTIERLQAISVLNSITDPAEEAGRTIEIEAINPFDADSGIANDQVVTVVFWEETNGIPGLQSKGENQDQFIAIDDPAGRFRVQDTTDISQAGQIVTYYARAYDRLEVPSAIARTDVQLLAPVPVPAKPAVLTARPIDQDTIRLQWRDKSNTEQGFRVEVSPTGEFKGEEVVYIANRNVEFIEIDGAAAAQTLVARVRAFNATGSSAFTGRAAVTTLGAGEILVNARGTDIADGGTVTSGGFTPLTTDTALFGDALQANGSASATFSFDVPADGTYALFVHYPKNADASENVAVFVTTAEGAVGELTLDQSRGGGGFAFLGNVALDAGTNSVELRSDGGLVYADAIRLLPLGTDTRADVEARMASTAGVPPYRPYNTVFSMRELGTDGDNDNYLDLLA